MENENVAYDPRMDEDSEEMEAWLREEDRALDALEGMTHADLSETVMPLLTHDQQLGYYRDLDLEKGAVPVSVFTQKNICYDMGEYVDYSRRPWMHRIMDSEYTRSRRGIRGNWEAPRWTLLRSSRQIEKSSSMSFKLLSTSMLIPNITCLYVSSAGANTKEFADERVDNTIRISPRLHRFKSRGLSDTMALKRFANNSRIVLRSVYRDNASRVRGVPADVISIDEIQDVFPETFPVIFAAAKNSMLEYGSIRLLSGTPLTTDNYIDRVWKKESTQNLWLTKCEACGHWNPPGYEQIGRYGMICEKCGWGLNPLLGQWVRTGPENAPYEGYHFSQVAMPYTAIDNTELFNRKWDELYNEVHSPNAIEAKVRNEILGESWDSGRKPITEGQLLSLCRPWLKMTDLPREDVLKDIHWPVFMGVDWGSGQDGTAYTVVTLLYCDGSDFKPVVFYMHRFEGPEANPAYIKRRLAQLIQQCGVTLCFVDNGFGWDIIPELRNMITDGIRRIIPVHYTISQHESIVYSEKAHRFNVHRTRWMAKIFNIMIRGNIDLPCEQEFRYPFGQDILNIYKEETPTMRMATYGHTDTDDSFHSLLYALTAKMYYYREVGDFANA